MKKSKLGYREGFLTGGVLLIIGFVWEVFSGGLTVPLPAWPYNLIVVSIGVSVLFTLGFIVKSPIVKWLGSLKAAVPAMTYFLALSLFMGLIPQESGGSYWLETLGLNHLTSNGALILSYLFLLICLVFSMRNRFRSLSLRNVAFLFNHLGLLILLIAMGVGKPDLYRLQMKVGKERAIFEGVNMDGKVYRTPFALKLIDFTMDEYPPHLLLINEKDLRPVDMMEDQDLMVEPGKAYVLNEWHIRIESYIEHAKKGENVFFEEDSVGAVHACLITATNVGTRAELNGWISTGSFTQRPVFLKLQDGHMLAITVPEAKDYVSTIRVFDTPKQFQDVEIRVNKPFRYKGWAIYQSGYDERFGKWSPVSDVELVFDRWIEIAYVGIFMMIVGAALLIWRGKEITEQKEE